MSDIALYHPYVDFRDEAWLKGAVLYWPRIARMLPDTIRNWSDSDLVRQLRDELGCIVDVRLRQRDYGGPLERAEQLFFRFLDRHEEELLPRYGVRRLGIDPIVQDRADTGRLAPRDLRLAPVMPGKMLWSLADRLADSGLLVPLEDVRADGRRQSLPYLCLHRDLATLYLAVLADAVASDNRMAMVTDLPVTLATSGGWTTDSMAAVLLDDAARATFARPEPAQAFAVLALAVAVPKDLRDVPIRRIIKARRKLQPQLLAYRAYLDSLAPALAELSAVPDPAVRAAHLEMMVEREIGGRINATARQLSKLGLQPVRALLTTQTLVPPAALAALGSALDLPPVVTGSGAVAATVVSATATMMGGREQLREAHPTGYLLGLRRELGASHTVAAVRAAYRRAAGTGRRG
ncbi:DUF6236 family protein [Micromonospora sp. NPDC047738]|uniref:DUF6236 family protein n=1 Tax=Micromonospora sp. NPDC047738 TaxID=3155741 RepID=UPI0033F156E0